MPVNAPTMQGLCPGVDQGRKNIATLQIRTKDVVEVIGNNRRFSQIA